MGKRSYKSNGGGSKSKKFKGGAMVEPGQVGIYASCNRHKEGQAAKELKMLFNDKLDEFYHDELEALNQENKEEGDDDNEELSIEESIKREVEQLKAGNKDSQKKDILKEMSINAESLNFIKTRKPIVPSDFVIRICEDLYKSKEKTSRFIQKLVPIDQSCSATESEFKKLATEIFKGHFDNKENYSINLIKRNFSVIDRDTFNQMIADLLPESGLRYKNADKVINVYCFKSNIGMSVVDYEVFDRLCKFNIQQIYDKVNGLLKEEKKEEEEKKDPEPAGEKKDEIKLETTTETVTDNNKIEAAVEEVTKEAEDVEPSEKE